jgi:hypothetical protein
MRAMVRRRVPADIAAAGCGVLVYAVLFLAIFSVTSAVRPMFSTDLAVALSLLALIPAAIALLLNYRWANAAVVLLLLPSMALTIGAMAQRGILNAGDAVMTALLLGLPLLALFVISRRFIASRN